MAELLWISVTVEDSIRKTPETFGLSYEAVLKLQEYAESRNIQFYTVIDHLLEKALRELEV